MLFITTNKSRESSGMKMYGVLSEYGGLRMKKNGKRYARRKIQERNNWGNNIQKIHSELVKTSSDIQDEEFLKESAERLIRILGEPTRTYKDRIFRMLLSDRKTALEVYNAMNDSNYDNPDELVFTTLKNAVYMGMKNDVSFIISSQLVLYEHQSSINPNMPLRDLFYTACVLSGLIMNENIYGKHQILVPEPKFVIFYNGKEKMPERSELRLSDAYEKHSGTPSLELVIQVININYGCNKELMEKSRTLREYMIFVETVRNYEKEYEFKEAVEYAIDDCIRNNILRSFLIKSRAEVLKVFLFEYDQEKHIRQEKDESREEGRKEGIKEGIKLGRKEGLELGEIQMLVKQMQKGRITMEEAAEDAGMTVEKFTDAMEHVMSQLI